MHSRPMFPILETQVGDGWVGDVDYEAGQQFPRRLGTRVPIRGQPVTRFDDLDGAESGAYRIAPPHGPRG